MNLPDGVSQVEQSFFVAEFVELHCSDELVARDNTRQGVLCILAELLLLFGSGVPEFQARFCAACDDEIIR